MNDTTKSEQYPELLPAILNMENDGQKPCPNKPNVAFFLKPRE
jgi:hypothetical protein